MTAYSKIVFKNTSWGLLAHFAIKSLSFVFSVFIIRNLGAGEFGKYSAVLAFTGAFAVLSDMGLGVYAVRQVARWRNQDGGNTRAENLYADVVVLRLILSFFTSLLLIVIAWVSKRPPLMIGAIALNSLSLFIYGIQGGSDMMLSGYERLDISAQAKIWNQAIFVSLGSIVLILGLGYYGLIVASLLSISATAFITWRGVRKIRLRIGRVSISNWKHLLRSSLPFGIIGLALGLSYKFDTILLNVFRGDQATGLYNAAYNLVFTAFVISGTINSSMYPSLTREFSKNAANLPRIVSRSLRYLFIISLPIAFGGWTLSSQIVNFLYDSEFAAASSALAIIIWTVPLMYASDLLGYIVLILDREKAAARAVTVSTGFNIALNLLLVPKFGYLAAALMTVITESVLVGQYLVFLRSELRPLDWERIIGRPLLASVIMIGPVLVVRGSIHVLFTVALGGVVYTLALLILGSIGKEELAFIRAFFNNDEKPAIGVSQENAS